jgi:hypothetical protein
MDRRVPGLPRRAIAARITLAPATATRLHIAGPMRELFQRHKLKAIAADITTPTTAALRRMAGQTRALFQRRKLRAIVADITPRPTTAARLRMAGPTRELFQRRTLRATAARHRIAGAMLALTQRRTLKAFPRRTRFRLRTLPGDNPPADTLVADIRAEAGDAAKQTVHPSGFPKSGSAGASSSIA